jgi:UDP-sugar transporter A1/2/3
MSFEIISNKKGLGLEFLIVKIKLFFLVFIQYMIPSFFYCLYNNLTFINLSSYDPTTYYLLLQFRVVITGFTFQVFNFNCLEMFLEIINFSIKIVFSKRLSRFQWLSLILLTCGCVIKQAGHANSRKNSEKMLDYHLILIIVQIFSAAFAGVYNEYLLKDTVKSNVNIMIQNVFMYSNSIICNIILFFVTTHTDMPVTSFNSLKQILSKEALNELLHFKVIIIILNNASIGIVTSLFLKSLNSIMKSFAGAIELMLTGILSWIIFSIPLDLNTIIAILFVSFSTWLYSRNPVQNTLKAVLDIENTG